jgi:hypothetical protein
MKVNDTRRLIVVIIMLALIATVLLAINAFAEEISPQVLNKVAMEIRIENPKASSSLLNNDQEVIKAALPAIKDNLAKKGFSEADINPIVAASWKNLRSPSSPLAPLDKSAVLNYINKLGKLKIESKPDGANIFIDDILQNEKTDTVKWLPQGRYRIIIIKTGYPPESEERDIVEGDNPPMSKILRPKRP